MPEQPSPAGTFTYSPLNHWFSKFIRLTCFLQETAPSRDALKAGLPSASSNQFLQQLPLAFVKNKILLSTCRKLVAWSLTTPVTFHWACMWLCCSAVQPASEWREQNQTLHLNATLVTPPARYWQNLQPSSFISVVVLWSYSRPSYFITSTASPWGLLKYKAFKKTKGLL